MKLIAFAGRKQSGKDTLGNFLLRNRGELLGLEHAKKYGWADPLKRQVGDMFGIPDEYLWGTDEDKNNKTSIKWGDLPHWCFLTEEQMNKHPDCLTVRELLQHYGTEVVRRMNPDAWVNCLCKQILREKPDLAVVIDTRFPNEVAAVKLLGGKVVRLTRMEHNEAKHESEYALDPDKYDRSNFDAVIDNKNMDHSGQERVLVNLLGIWGWMV